jgi:putative intracellular protease/amidase
MKRFLVLIPPKDFKDESLDMVTLFLNKWGIKFMITSYTSNECKGIHGATVRPDLNASRAYTEEYDGIVLIDGHGVDDYKMYDYRPLLDMMLRFNDKKKPIVAINNAVKIPARANIVKGLKISTDDQEAKRLVILFHGTPSEKSYEISSNIITVRKSEDLEEALQKILDQIG